MSGLASSPSRPGSTVVALSGNPRAGSRTSIVARAVADRVAALVPGGAQVVPVDLAGLASEVFAPVRPSVDQALAAVAAARVVVVATPVYKASYTGLLKAFLDLYGPRAWAGVVAVPVVVSASPAHALAGEVHLRPLLVELGATVPTRALAVTESELADLDAVVSRWLVEAAPLLRGAAGLEAVR